METWVIYEARLLIMIYSKASAEQDKIQWAALNLTMANRFYIYLKCH